MKRLEELEKRLREECPGLELRKNEPMSKHTTLRVGGPAALMAQPKTPGEAGDLLRVCQEQKITPFFMGNGSNLLVSDQGYNGLVISTVRLDRLKRSENFIVAGSGVLLSKLANFAAQEGLSGLEWAAGIPGTVGGAVYMNAGAYGGEAVQVLDFVNYFGEDVGSFRVMDGKLFLAFGTPSEKNGILNVNYREVENSTFSYRHSYFCDKELFVTMAGFRLTRGDPGAIKARMAELSAQRKAKQPLEYPSAGSTFKRPAPLPDGTPVYAAALIDQCGCKGLAVGGAQVSEKHAGFIVNRGGATSADILALVEEVKKRVLDQTGVALELEVKTLGV